MMVMMTGSREKTMEAGSEMESVLRRREEEKEMGWDPRALK